MFEWFHTLLQWLQHHPHVAFAVVFLIALSESLAIVGLFIPGSVALGGIGVLIGSGFLSLWPTLYAAMMGAILGDIISFAIGARYRHAILERWPFFHFAKFFVMGEAFLAKHGGKSIFLGRFLGPVRPIIPMVAGMLKVSWRRFIIADVCSGLLWAPAYIAPGLMLTWLTQSYASFEQRKLILLLALLTFGGWLLSHLWQLNVQYRWLVKLSQRLALSLNHILGYKLFNVQKFPHLLLNVLLSILLLGTIALVLSAKCLYINQTIWHYFSQMSPSWFDKIMIGLTLLGEKWLMLVFYLGVLLYLCWQRWWPAGFFWFFNGALVVSSTWYLKMILQISRPQGIELRDTFSFPSAHSSLSVGLWGGFYILLTMGSKTLPKLHVTTLLLCIYMAMSRLYLNAHWFFDVFTGIIVGLWSLSLSTWFKPNNMPSHFSPYRLLFIGLISLSLAWLYHIGLYIDEYWLEYESMRAVVFTAPVEADF